MIDRNDRDYARGAFKYKTKIILRELDPRFVEHCLMGSNQINRQELKYLMDLVNLVEGGNIANLGCFKGHSASALAYTLKHFDLAGHVYTIDLYGTKAAIKPRGSFEKAKLRFERIGLQDRITQCTGTTIEWASNLEKEFSLVFIDADHTYEGCKADFDAWYPKLRLNGVIAFHDIHLDSVSAVIEEVKEAFDVVELPGCLHCRALQRIG